jgi:hypothetical protein
LTELKESKRELSMILQDGKAIKNVQVILSCKKSFWTDIFWLFRVNSDHAIFLHKGYPEKTSACFKPKIRLISLDFRIFLLGEHANFFPYYAKLFFGHPVYFLCKI